MHPLSIVSNDVVTYPAAPCLCVSPCRLLHRLNTLKKKHMKAQHVLTRVRCAS